MSDVLTGVILVVFVAAIIVWRFVNQSKTQVMGDHIPPPHRLSVIKPITQSTAHLDTPVVADTPYTSPIAVSSLPEREEEDNDGAEDVDLTPDELVAKFWPTDTRTNAEKAREVLCQAEQETGVNWGDEAEDESPAPSDFVAPLRNKGCTTVDLLIAFDEETGLLWGEIIDKTLKGTQVSVAELIQAHKGCPDEEFGSEELDSIIDQEALTTDEIYLFARGIGISCGRLMELYEDHGYPDLDDIAEPARAAGYSDAEIMDAFCTVTEDYGTEVNAALSSNIPLPTIIDHLFGEDERLERLEDDFIEAEVEFEARINILYGLIHHAPVTTEEAAEAPTT